MLPSSELCHVLLQVVRHSQDQAAILQAPEEGWRKSQFQPIRTIVEQECLEDSNLPANVRVTLEQHMATGRLVVLKVGPVGPC